MERIYDILKYELEIGEESWDLKGFHQGFHRCQQLPWVEVDIPLNGVFVITHEKKTVFYIDGVEYEEYSTFMDAIDRKVVAQRRLCKINKLFNEND